MYDNLDRLFNCSSNVDWDKVVVNTIPLPSYWGGDWGQGFQKGQRAWNKGLKNPYSKELMAKKSALWKGCSGKKSAKWKGYWVTADMIFERIDDAAEHCNITKSSMFSRINNTKNIKYSGYFLLKKQYLQSPYYDWEV